MTARIFTNFLYHTEIEDVAKLFFSIERAENQQSADIVCTVWVTDGVFFSKTTMNGISDTQSVVLPLDKLHSIRLQKRLAKISTYICLKKATGISQPWGCLTGIRPTKLAYQLIEENGEFVDTFKNTFDVSKQKIDVVWEILNQQKGLLTTDERAVDLYVSIPFCQSRCSYCSFTSGEIHRLKQYVEPYVSALCDDLLQTQKFAKSNGFSIKTIYFGGGTPTVLDVHDLKRILLTLDHAPTEFTIEAGRPDTITREKLQLFSDFGVNRISINPQTFNQRILDLVGRKHTVEDIFEKFSLARNFSFDINMDLIAGLPTESYEEFCHSLDCAVGLNPENITVHTLALKKGSILKINQQIGGSNGSQVQNDESDSENEIAVSNMVDYSYKKLLENNFRPYYMYRQKYMKQNLENVGYSKPKKACQYNIDNMEETTSILACGASGISKRIFPAQNRIERAANPKDVKTYIENTQNFIDQKLKLF